MPQGGKSKYTDKQFRQAGHIADGYENGLPEGEAERRAWTTVNEDTGGGKKSASGRDKPENHAPVRKGGRLGGRGIARPLPVRLPRRKPQRHGVLTCPGWPIDMDVRDTPAASAVAPQI